MHISEVLYVAIQISVKVSILLFYIRVFPHRFIKIISWILIIDTVVHGTLFIFLLAFRCDPVHATWTIVPTAKCLSFEAISIVGAVSSLVEDLVILALPIPILIRLNMRRSQRIVLVLLFSVCSLYVLTRVALLVVPGPRSSSPCSPPLLIISFPSCRLFIFGHVLIQSNKSTVHV